MKALYSFQSRCRSLGISTPSFKLRLFHTLVVSAFSHGCQLWSVGAPDQLIDRPQQYPLEAVQLLFLRYMAGVGSSAHILSLLAEFAHTPILHQHLKLAARFWNKLRASDCTSALRQAWVSDLQLAISSRYELCWSFQFL